MRMRLLPLSLVAVAAVALTASLAHGTSSARNGSYTGFRHAGDQQAAIVALKQSYQDTVKSLTCTRHGIYSSTKVDSDEQCSVVGAYAGVPARYTCTFEFYTGLRFPAGQCRHDADIQGLAAVNSVAQL